MLQIPRAASLGLGDDTKSLAFHEREWSKLGVLATGGSGGITLRTWTFSGPPDGKDDRADMADRFNWSFKTLRSLKCRREDDGVAPTVTSLKFVGSVIVHLWLAIRLLLTLLRISGSVCSVVMIVDGCTRGTCPSEVIG